MNYRQRSAVPTTTSTNHSVVIPDNNDERRKATQRPQGWNSPNSDGAGEWPRSGTTERPSNRGFIRQASRPYANTNSNTSATTEHGTSPRNKHATRQEGQLPPQHQDQDGGREDRGHGSDARSHDQAGSTGKDPADLCRTADNVVHHDKNSDSSISHTDSYSSGIYCTSLRSVILINQS